MVLHQKAPLGFLCSRWPPVHPPADQPSGRSPVRFLATVGREKERLLFWFRLKIFPRRSNIFFLSFVPCFNSIPSKRWSRSSLVSVQDVLLLQHTSLPALAVGSRCLCGFTTTCHMCTTCASGNCSFVVASNRRRQPTESTYPRLSMCFVWPLESIRYLLCGLKRRAHHGRCLSNRLLQVFASVLVHHVGDQTHDLQTTGALSRWWTCHTQSSAGTCRKRRIRLTSSLSLFFWFSD